MNILNLEGHESIAYVYDGNNSKKGLAVGYSQDGVLCIMEQKFYEVKRKPRNWHKLHFGYACEHRAHCNGQTEAKAKHQK